MKNDFREFPSQGTRKKVDLHNMGNVADVSQHREKDPSESRSVFDLRKSLAWDSAFFDSPGVLDPEELCETLKIQLKDRSDANRQGVSDSKESARVNTISNLRKSLAWDNAFFTSAGVLDAEELSIVNRGFKRPDSIQFSGKIWESPSNSIVNTNDFSLASLEIDLFDDVRSSRDALPNVATLTGKLEKKKGKPDNRTSKISICSSQVQHGAPNKESGSSHKPPKISSHSNPSRIVPSKRPSQVNKALKSATGKKLCLGEPCNVLSSSMSSLKSPSSVLPASRNDHPGLRYASVDLINRSPSNPRRRIDSRMAASVSSLKTPLKYSTKNKTVVVGSSDSIRLFSTPKSSPYTSPGSSIDTSSSEQSLTSTKQNFLFDASKTLNFAKVRDTKLLDSRNKVLRSTTPSGLRMPSPKLGYFDDERSIGLAESVDLKFQSGSGISSVKGSTNVRRYGRNQLAGTLSKAVKNEKQGLKENGHVKEKKVSEDNKENVIMENRVNCLTRRIGAMTLSRDLGNGHNHII